MLFTTLCPSVTEMLLLIRLMLLLLHAFSLLFLLTVPSSLSLSFAVLAALMSSLEFSPLQVLFVLLGRTFPLMTLRRGVNMDKKQKYKYLSSSVSRRVRNGIRKGYYVNKYGYPTRGSVQYSPSCVSDGSYEFDIEYWRKEYEFLYGGSK